MTEPLDVGDRPTLFVTIRDEDGNLADPAELSLVVRRPDDSLEVIDTFDHVMASGYYEARVDIDQAGAWRGEWRAINPNVVEPFRFYVRTSAIGEVVT